MHRDWLINTLELAKVRKGFCAPNPSVGAVVVKDNQCLSQAAHFKAGEEHAEYQALKQLEYPLTGATLYISLEPCSHWGKTPPCINEIIRSGVSKVVYAYSDPHPLVAPFDTVDFFKKNNIDCEQVIVPEITAFYSSYKYWVQTKRPFVTLKIAQSINGKICLASGEPVQLTGKQANDFTHKQRKQADMILTTARTIKNDNPKFTARCDNKEIDKPISVLDSKLEIANELNLDCKKNIKNIFYDERLSSPVNLQEHEYFAVSNNEGLNLQEVVTHLGEQGVHDLWVEAGGKLATALLQQKLVNRLYVYVSPRWLSEDSVDAYVDINEISDKDYASVSWQQLGNDMMITFEFE